MSEQKLLSDAEAVLRELDVVSVPVSQQARKAPVVENLLPALPGDKATKLQRSRQGKDCRVIVEDLWLPPGLAQGDAFMVLLKNGSELVSHWMDVPIPPPVKFEMTLAGAFTDTMGLFRLSYMVHYLGNAHKSDTSEFVIDRVAPNYGNPGIAAVPPSEIIKGVVTRKILDALGDITMIIPTPADVKQGDVCMGYYGSRNSGIYVDRHVVDDDISAPIQIKIPRASVEDNGDGVFFFYYIYEDRVGNVGPSSRLFQFEIQLTPVSVDRVD
ncbi:hypothetical protein ACP3TY_22100 [Pseudomonas rustica]|uniref:hypothetical protein n=1 Tax=Pseudomonas rustica TaxID=2827099 RepID=UPI003CEB2A5A